MREPSGNPLKVGEYPIAPFAPQPAKRIDKKIAVVHDPPQQCGVTNNGSANCFVQLRPLGRRSEL
jgi:hypothetical protein